MKAIVVSIFALGLTLGTAQAQSDNAVPGIVGAMNLVAQGVATSPQDVLLQQEGRSTASAGARPLANRPATDASGQSAGTVGAAPGQ